MFVGKSWTSGTKKLFYDANSKRGGALMHAKVSFSHPIFELEAGADIAGACSAVRAARSRSWLRSAIRQLA
jgi:hypothetical protein